MRLISPVAPCTSRGGVSYRAKPKLRRGPHRREHRAAHEFGLSREGEGGSGLLGHAVAWSATVDQEGDKPSPTTLAPRAGELAESEPPCPITRSYRTDRAPTPAPESA